MKKLEENIYLLSTSETKQKLRNYELEELCSNGIISIFDILFGGIKKMKKKVDYKKKYKKMRNDYFQLAIKYVNNNEDDYKQMYYNLLEDYININTKYVELQNSILTIKI